MQVVTAVKIFFWLALAQVAAWLGIAFVVFLIRLNPEIYRVVQEMGVPV